MLRSEPMIERFDLTHTLHSAFFMLAGCKEFCVWVYDFCLRLSVLKKWFHTVSPLLDDMGISWSSKKAFWNNQKIIVISIIDEWCSIQYFVELLIVKNKKIRVKSHNFEDVFILNVF